ncbi:MAG: EamA family transporter [Flavobacteriaceae bacterium]|nr:EamA family transporter [Flavobacteriaceae bacterium]
MLLNLATLFISTSGALGKFIAMPTPVIIWWRSSIALLILFAICKFRKINLKINSKKDLWTFVLSALFMGGHWITYFYSLKFSNVAIGMLSLYTFPVITALLEPLFIKIKLDPIHIFLGFLVLIGIYILAPEFNLESSHVQGILLGLLSALCYSLRILILKQHVINYNGTMLMMYQLLILTIVLAPFLYVMDTSGISTQFPYVLLLAVLTTAIGHTMFVHSLKHFSSSTASIMTSALPVYGIIIAYFFLDEIPSKNVFIGGLLIISTVLIEGIRSRKKA